MKAITFAALLCVACVTQAAKPADEPKPPTQSPAAKAQAELRRSVEALLAREPTEDDFKKLGPDALAVLEQVYNDPAQAPSARQRAVACMALVDNADAAKKLEGIISDEKAEPASRGAAAKALAHRLGDKAIAAVQPLLDGKNAELRDAAAKAIASIGSADARAALEERLGKEEDPTVREAIQQSLTKMQP